MYLTHKIELKPTNKQKGYFVNACGASRYAYNWALDRWNSYREAGIKVNVFQLDKDFTKGKKTLHPWTYNVTKCATQNAIKKDLQSAFQKFFKEGAGYPKFKKKGRKASFMLNNDTFSVFDDYIKVPHVGIVKTTESLRFRGKIANGVISEQAGKWFISIQVKLDDYALPKAEGSIGIDLGIKTAIVTSNNDFLDSPKPLKKQSKSLRRRHKDLSRKTKGSNNYRKAKNRLAKKHKRIADIRKDWIHKTTSKISNENQIVCMEDLGTSNMMKNHKLAKAISDMGWYEIYRQLDYKTKRRNGVVVKIDRFYPSSKTCTDCGLIKDDLTLKDRLFECECGFKIDRDLNASINIHTAGLAEIYACGDNSAGLIHHDSNETITVKQELIKNQ